MDASAYAMASAHLRIKHVKVMHLVLASTHHEVFGEAWQWADQLMDPCKEPLAQILATARLQKETTYINVQHLPTFIHYNHAYAVETHPSALSVAQWYFEKSQMPPSIFSCASPPLATPPKTLLEHLLKTNEDHRNTVIMTADLDYNPSMQLQARAAWLVCVLIDGVNQAKKDIAREFCPHPSADAGDGDGEAAGETIYTRHAGRADKEPIRLAPPSETEAK